MLVEIYLMQWIHELIHFALASGLWAGLQSLMSKGKGALWAWPFVWMKVPLARAIVLYHCMGGEFKSYRGRALLLAVFFQWSPWWIPIAHCELSWCCLRDAYSVWEEMCSPRLSSAARLRDRKWRKWIAHFCWVGGYEMFCLCYSSSAGSWTDSPSSWHLWEFFFAYPLHYSHGF